MFFRKDVNPENGFAANNSNYENARREGGIGVLLISDNQEINGLFSHAIYAGGFDCSVAQNKEEALSNFIHQRPEVVVLDAEMPKKGALKVAKEMLSLRSKTKIIVLLSKSSVVSKELEHLGVELFFCLSMPSSGLIESVKALAELKKTTCELVAP